MEKVEKFLEYSKVDPTELGLLAAKVYEDKLQKEFIQWFGEMTAAEILAISKYLLMKHFEPMPDNEPDIEMLSTVEPKKKTKRKAKKKTKTKSGGGVVSSKAAQFEMGGV